METLQKELEIFADRSRHDMEQLKAELNSTQEVNVFLVFVEYLSALESWVLKQACLLSRNMVMTC